MHKHHLFHFLKRLFHCGCCLALCALFAPPAEAHGFRRVQKQVIVVQQAPAFAFVEPSFGFQQQVFLSTPAYVPQAQLFLAPSPILLPSSSTTVTRFGPFGNVRSVKQFNQ